MTAVLLALALWPQEAKAPFEYVRATAHHILPETTSEESGYFSLSEGPAGRIYVGTAKYGANSFLVEFEPRTARQRIVLDTHKVCGVDAIGYASQAKLHTRNFVAPSGRIYVGSKQGYRKKGDLSTYPGGYVMVYDPADGRSRNLGMPFPEQGVIDVVADETRGLLYVVTCEDQHWMVGPLGGGTYRELGPMLTPYATTLVKAGGKAHALTKDFQLATYDPESKQVSVTPIHVDGERWVRPNRNAIPTWQLAPDGRSAYLILMNDARLIRIDLADPGKAVRLGTMVQGRNPDSRASLTIAPDGRVYALIRVDNTTGFGKGYLHHLARFDPTTGSIDDLGVLAIGNPDYYDFGKKRPWSHGFHRLPDSTLTPLHAHMGLLAARDGSLYATILYPFTLLRIEPPPRTVAVLTTAYYHNSHADVIASRLLETDTLDGKGRRPRLRMASLYLDQISASPPDVGVKLASEHKVPKFDTIRDALTLGTDTLAVDGILLIAEHGKYPRSATGSIQYPKRRFFEQVVAVFRESGRVVPVFCDKHLADTWTDAKWIHDTARDMGIPLMAGSSLPTLWRYPAADPPRNEELEEIVAVSYHTLDAYGFHALEMLQTIVERRKGGETGIRAVRCVEGEAVWKAKFDRSLLDDAVKQLKTSRTHDLARRVRKPVLFTIEYADGLRASVLTLNPAIHEWSIAWKTRSGKREATLFYTQEARPFMHFTYLLEGIEAMVHTRRPAWPAQRTLLTSGALDRLLISRREQGRRIETPELTFPYRAEWTWRQPPPPPPDRPIRGK